MKRKKIETALENIDPAYIESAANYRKKHSPESRILKWGAIAASFSVILLAGALFMRGTIPSPDSPSTGSKPDIPPESSDIANNVYWSETPIENGVLEKKKLSVIDDPIYKNYISLRVIDPAHVGEKLGDTEIRSFWRNYLINEDTDLELLRAEIYAIKGISPETAVCIRYLDKGDALTTSHYYIYINPDDKPQDYEDFYRIFALDGKFTAKSNVTLAKPSREGTTFQYCNPNADMLAQFLNTLTEAKTRSVNIACDNIFRETEKDILKNCFAQASFTGETPLGGTFIGRIYDTGYLIIRINDDLSYVFEFSEKEMESIFLMINDSKIEQTSHETVIGESESTSNAVLPE